MRVLGLLFALLAPALPVLTSVLQAQQGPSGGAPTRVPVTVALAGELPDGARFQILRRVDKNPHDVILFAPGADSLAFSEAIQQLILIRQVQGDTARVGGAMRLRRPSLPNRAQSLMVPWANRVLADLHRAAPSTIEGVGNVRAVQIWLPPQHGRQGRRNGA